MLCNSKFSNYLSVHKIYQQTIVNKFADKTYEEADKLVNESKLAREAERVSEVYYLIHEIEYHWAMLLVYGNMYWLHGVPYPEPCSNEEYVIWESEISEKYNLKEICEFYSE